MLKKYKDDQEFYSLVGIKPQTFHKMVEILKVAESKQKYYGGKKNKLGQCLVICVTYKITIFN